MNKTTKYCKGCTDNYYNIPGNSENGCWLLENAKIVEKTRVGVWDNPPYKWMPEKIYHCNRPSGYVYLSKEDQRFKK